MYEIATKGCLYMQKELTKNQISVCDNCGHDMAYLTKYNLYLCDECQEELELNET
jgi:predicted RNA-binding Zn-ribbon protein involved in translation (DUF1610 family)